MKDMSAPKVQVAQEEIAATLAGELDMHIEDLAADGEPFAVEGYLVGPGSPVVTGCGPEAEGDTFYVTASTGQRFRVQVTEVTE